MLYSWRGRPGWVLFISGLLGFWVGIVGFPTWAIPVESAQVVAGLVKYPADNPFYIYHTKIWTLLIQLCAVLLRAGVSEIALSRLLSGILGMVSFQALAVFAYAIGGDALLAIGSAFVIFFSRITDSGVVYPVMLLDTHHTYGALGLSLMVLVTALIGAGFYRTGGFLLGLSPAVHPSLGAWFGVVVALCLAWDFRNSGEDLRPALKYFLAGAVITAASLIAQLTLISHRAHLDAAVSAAYFRAFVAFWDEHRRAVQLSQPGVMLNVGALALAAIWLNWLPGEIPRPARFLLRTVIVSAAIGLAAAFFTWIPPAQQPVLLSMLMPARLLNYNVMVIGPLVVGLLASRRKISLSQLVLAVFLGGVLLNERSMFQFHPLNPTLVLGLGTIAVALLAFLKSPSDRFFFPARMAAIGIAALAVFLTLRVSRSASFYRDRTNDPFFATVSAEQQGLVLTGGSYQLVQQYTRRPVLIDGGGLDTITYAPETGPAMRRILRDIYEIDYFNPPAWARGSSLLPHDKVRPVWETFSLEKWQDIRRTYDVTQVLTRADYNLKLPIVADNGSFRLYVIPRGNR